MQTNDILHGFRVLYSQTLPEIGATLWRMEYEKNGADLIWLDRDDDNKTFAITFKTIPQDDTGVFHILEHSVLCGSEKYPVKEPFVELIKSSMATFLNAITFADKTMYPVSSRNAQDFLNLVDVYMDAVLHPLSITDPHAFRQEGWHYELDDAGGELRLNGVVYNEMKGAYASPDTVLMSELNRMLFPDTCYGYESGGHPDHIPELTYENYLASHRRFYHPSNARIVLDGAVDLDTVLEKLDGFLSSYDRIDPDADIPFQAPVTPEEHTCYYEIGPEEDTANKAILAGGWVFGRFDDVEEGLAFSALTSVLTSSNESPLTKALLDGGLAEDVSFQKDDSMLQQYATLVIRNTDPTRKEEIWQTVERTLAGLADNGLDHKRLHSILSRLEFVTREKDYGGMPRGIIYAITAMEGWLYGGDPAQNFRYSELFRSLREKVDSGWFEDFLRRTLLDNPHRARVCMLPSKTLGEEKRAKEAARLAGVKASWSEDDIAQVIARFQTLRARQEAPDDPAQLAALPKLSLSDIPEQGTEPRQNVTSLDGVTVLHHPVETDGITYLDLYFSLADLPLDRLSQVSFLADLIGQVATEHYSVLELRSEIEGSLGHFGASTAVYTGPNQADRAVPYLTVSAALLADHKADAVRLLGEILSHSRFDDTQYVYNLLRQNRLGLEQGIIMSGNSFAAIRSAAGCSPKGAVREALRGITLLRWLQEADRTFDTSGEALCQTLSGLHKSLFSRSRLTVSVTGELDLPWLSDVLGVLSNAPMGESAAYQPAPPRREGFIIPAQIGFAAKSANLNDLDAAYAGPARVAAQLLTFDYLWNDVRVKGGAYGVNLSVRTDGDVSFSSYRDPSPARTLQSFDHTGQALRDFCESGEDLDKYIVSTVAAVDPLLSPRTEGLMAAALYLNGQTADDLRRERREILHTTAKQLEQFSHTLDRACEADRVCVIGGKAALDACGDALDMVESLQ